MRTLIRYLDIAVNRERIIIGLVVISVCQIWMGIKKKQMPIFSYWCIF